MQRPGVSQLRKGLSRADSYRPEGSTRFDRQMDALADFALTVTFCLTPEQEGIAPHHISPPKDPRFFADLCGRMIERYAPARPTAKVA